MVIEIISLIVLTGSLAGLFAFVAKKMRIAEQVAVKPGDIDLAGLGKTARNWLEAKVKTAPGIRDFSWMNFVQKILLKGRVMTLKAENKINDYMVKLRQRAEEQQKKEEALLDNYWRDLKTIVKTKKPLYRRDAKTSVVELDPETKTGPAAGTATAVTVKTALPEPLPKSPQHKKKHHAKKKKYRDPFQW